MSFRATQCGAYLLSQASGNNLILSRLPDHYLQSLAQSWKKWENYSGRICQIEVNRWVLGQDGGQLLVRVGWWSVGGGWSVVG